MTADQDWINRSTAPGVLFATDFRADADVLPHRFAAGMDPTLLARVTRFTGDGITGGSCLRIDTPAGVGVDTSPAWIGSLNPKWTSNAQGMGRNPFWIQFRLKIPASRLVKGANPDGWKFVQVSNYNPQSPSSSRSNTLFEVVGLDDFMKGYPQAYCRDAAGGFPQFPVTKALPWLVDQWRTIQLRIAINKYGGVDPANAFDMWVADPGWTQWGLVSSARGFSIGPLTDSDGAPLPGGYNGIWLHAFETSGHDGAPATYQLWDQLIVSLNPVAIPNDGAAPATPDLIISDTGLKVLLPSGQMITT